MLSAVAVAGIAVFLLGAALTTVGFFTPREGSTFSGKAAGMSLTTSNVGLALCFFGCVFVALAAALKPVSAVLFMEEDRRTWLERSPPWLAPLGAIAAFCCLVELAVSLGVLR